jgi:integrase
MPLSDVAVRSAKPTESVQKLSDGGGLQLWITPNGSKLWRLAYRFAGKQRKLAIGTYPVVGLSEARAKREEAKRHLADGRDPSSLKKLEKDQRADAAGHSFDLIAGELRQKKRLEGISENTLGKIEWMHGIASPDIGQRPIADITAPEVLRVLKKVEARGRIETANRLRSVIGEVFRFAIATGRATNDPTQALRGALVAPSVRHRAAITDPAALGGLLRAINAFQGQPTTNAALKLMAYLFPRPGELRLAEWQEFDLAKAVWTIPAARMKMRREHRIPLPRQALEILQDLHAITGTGLLVFPGYGMSGGTGRKLEQRPLSESTMNVALRRMDYAQDEMTAHGFRAAASTLLNESGKFSADAIERALAHQDPDAVRRAYARGEHWEERERMMTWWADYLDALRDGAKVIPFDKQA